MTRTSYEMPNPFEEDSSDELPYPPEDGELWQGRMVFPDYQLDLDEKAGKY